jgi:hypothetical protein
VEQSAGAIAAWCADVANFAQREADLLAAGQYRAADLATVQVRLLRIWVTNVVRMAGVLSDNLALLSAGGRGERAPRTFGIRVDVPAGVRPVLTCSGLKGGLLGHRIPASRIRVGLRGAAEAWPKAASTAVDVLVEVDCAGVPNDTYRGVLTSTDGALRVPVRVAVNDFGTAVP